MTDWIKTKGNYPSSTPMVNHEIIHGDCIDVLPTLDRKADLILTPPPVRLPERLRRARL